MDIITKEEQKNININLKQKLDNRTKKISSYLGSDGVKSSVKLNDNNDVSYAFLPDKITNTNMLRVKNSITQDSKKNFVKSFKRAYENKRVYYV
jgi:hypothetical protein